MSDTSALAVSTAPVDSLDALTTAIGVFGAMERSSILPKGINNSADAAIVAMYGARFGWGPVASLFNCYIVEGSPSLKSDCMVGVVLSRRDVCEYFDCVHTDALRATYATKRVGSTREITLSYTIDQAQRAGLLNRGPWKQHPEDMLRHRCTSKLVRMVYPDLFAGVLTPDEQHDKSAPRAPVAHPQQHRAVQPDVVDAVFVPDTPRSEEGERKESPPQLSSLGFSAACLEMGLSRDLVCLWREEVSPKSEWSDFRRGGVVAILKGYGGKWELARGIEPTGPAAWELFDSLTDGTAGGAAIAAGVEGIEAHELMRGDWLAEFFGRSK